MRSNSVEVSGVQSDTVSGNVDKTGISGCVDVPFSETLAEPYDGVEEDLVRERGSVGMEVHRDADTREFLGDLDRCVDDEGTSSSEGKRGSVDVEVNGIKESGSKEDLGVSKTLVDGECVLGAKNWPDKFVDEMKDDVGANTVAVECSVEQQLSSKPLNDDGFGREVKATDNGELLPYEDKAVYGNASEVINSVGLEYEALVIESEAAMNNKVNNGVHVTVEGFSDTNGVNLVDDLEVCVKRDWKNSKSGGCFCASDLVWGKVRSHPWWPGQIYEPGDASKMARKHFRSKGYLVAYFGDQTFAWNEETKLKPFVPHFSQMVKQTSMEAFRHAVDCALDEVSRRVEFGLSCRCVSDDVYNKLKTQVIENAGIREQSSVREGGDRFLTACNFEPLEFLEYVKGLAQEPHVEADSLKHVMARGQMLAFYRWKGYYHLAKFGPLIGYLNNEVDSPNAIQEDKEEICKMSDDGIVASKRIVKDHGSRPQKRENMSGDSGHSTKKAKCLSELVKKGSYKEDDDKSDDDKETDANLSSKAISSSIRRGKTARLFHNDSKTEDCSPQSTGKTGRASSDLKPSFRVGESILRVAGKLSQLSPLLKFDVSSHGKTAKGNGGSKQSQKHSNVVLADCSSDEILAALHFAAMEPLKDHGLLDSMASFFSDFRNSVVQDIDLLQKHEEKGKDVGMSEERPIGSAEMTEKCSSGSKSEEKASDSEITTMSDSEAVDDAYCSEKVISIPEHQAFSSDEYEVGRQPSKVDGVSAVVPEMEGTVLGSEPHTGSESAVSDRGQLDEKMQQEDSPTALTLKFTDMDSIPSEAKLNQIFSHFGPLKESETEVLTKKNCARVVFKRRIDAETAFSSSGKFETFGPSLVCYRLNYAPSPRKSSSVEAKRRRKDA